MLSEILSTPMGLISVTEPGGDLNDYKNAGIYFFATAYTPTNAPPTAYGNGWCVVLQATTEGYEKQIWVALGRGITYDNKNEIYMRGKFATSEWSEWVKVPCYDLNRIDGNDILTWADETKSLDDYISELPTGRKYTAFIQGIVMQTWGLSRRARIADVYNYSTTIKLLRFYNMDSDSGQGEILQSLYYSGEWKYEYLRV